MRHFKFDVALRRLKMQNWKIAPSKIDSFHLLNLWGAPLGQWMLDRHEALNGKHHPYDHNPIFRGEKWFTENEIARSLNGRGETTVTFCIGDKGDRGRTLIIEGFLTFAIPTKVGESWLLSLEGTLTDGFYKKVSVPVEMVFFYHADTGGGFAFLPGFAKAMLESELHKYREDLSRRRSERKTFSLKSDFSSLAEAIKACDFDVMLGLAETLELIPGAVHPVDVSARQTDFVCTVDNKAFLSGEPRIVDAIEFFTFAAHNPEELAPGELVHMYHTVWEAEGRMFWALTKRERQDGRVVKVLEIKEGDNSGAWIEDGLILTVC
jgi:hypothetical protein